jgi:hypothetical protein
MPARLLVTHTIRLSRRLLLPHHILILPPQGGPYVDAYLMWPTSADAAAAVDAAVNMTVSSGHLQSNLQRQSRAHPQAQALHSAGSRAGLSGLKPGPGRTLPLPSLRGLGRREWRLCFSDVRVKLSGRRREWVEGLKLVVVPDNAEALLTGEPLSGCDLLMGWLHHRDGYGLGAQLSTYVAAVLL